MRYPDLLRHVRELLVGRHKLCDVEGGEIVIHNTGVRHPDLSDRHEFRLLLRSNGRCYAPRHTDFFSDFLLKLDAQPDQRLSLTDACEQVCNEADPVTVLEKRGFPKYFSKPGEETWNLQTSSHETAGLSTEMLFHGLQAMVAVYDVNDPPLKAPEAFRKVFVDLSHGIPLHEAVAHLQPAVRPGKRYFDRFERAHP